jgi:adenylate cyclase
VALGVAFTISFELTVLVSKSINAPLRDLLEATERVKRGDLSARVPILSGDEMGDLAGSFNDMMSGLEERETLHSAFGSYVDPEIARRVLDEGELLRGDEVEVSVLFVDIRDFTPFAESASAAESVSRLNEFFELVVPILMKHGGHANKFIGDGLLAVFGAPARHPDHAARAVAAAREIAEVAPLRVGVGVNTGRAVVGTIGGGGRRDFTVIGDPVNTAARVEAATRLTGDDILITESTLAALGPGAAHAFQERRSAPLKGKSEPVRLYAPRHPEEPEDGLEPTTYRLQGDCSTN